MSIAERGRCLGDRVGLDCSDKTLSDSHFRERYYKAVADVLLTYIFAGRREEGWSYFNKNYRLCDKGHSGPTCGMNWRVQ